MKKSYFEIQMKNLFLNSSQGTQYLKISTYSYMKLDIHWYHHIK
jgi:hypothetical protein